jgi:cytochrome c oxidase accessory protein FixG
MSISDEESYRDRIATIDEQGKRSWVYAYKPSGRFYTARSWLSLLYLLVFFGLPFLRYKGEPFLLLNILERKFVIFGSVFWSQDFFLFGVSMILFVVFIIVFTVAFGRLFCGWACPQTIFMEMVFRRIEYWIEGDAPKQQALNRAPWSLEKWAKKLSKWSVFYALSFLIGNTFLAYIIGTEALFAIMGDNPMNHLGGLASMIVFSLVFFFVYLWFREQVCTVVCPYGRLQGVLLDRHSVVVAYDHVRGEKRGKMRKGQDRSELGDCIDCLRCVHVCPTGVDIRNGTQLECTNCTACIDACDAMMDKIDKPRGLIRYASESNIADGKPFEITSRLKAYMAVLVLLLGLWGIILSTRTTLELRVRKLPGKLYIPQKDGSISNVYKLFVLSKSHEDMDSLRLEIVDAAGRVRVVGDGRLYVPAEQILNTVFFIDRQPVEITQRKENIELRLMKGDIELDRVKTNFMGPVSKNNCKKHE